MAVNRLTSLLRVLGNSARLSVAPKLKVSRRILSATTSKNARTIESKKVEVNGVQLHYEKTGEGDHNVLLLPGALGSSRTDFSPQLEKMDGDRFTIYSWDPRGYGKSRPPDRDWPLHFYHRDAEDAVALIKALDLSPVSLLGWSDGGITAFIIAGKHPELCRKLVAWGANAHISAEDARVVSEVGDIDKWSDRMKKPFIDVYGEDYFRTQWTSWVDAYRRILYENDGDICTADLANITCPTLIIHGQLDQMLDQKHPDYLHKHIKNSRIVYWPKAKHNLHLRYADDFNKTVEDFLVE